MKNLLIITATLMLCFGPLGMELAFADYTIDFNIPDATDNGDPIGDLYADLGIHFLTDTTSLTNPGIQFNGSTILPEGETNALFWYPMTTTASGDPMPLPDYPYPTTPYVAMTKPVGQTVFTGVALQFDYMCNQIAFISRRPGNNDTETEITISYFDTTQSNSSFLDEKITVRVYARAVDDPDGDGWMDYASNLQRPFDLVTLSGNKKFALDNLFVDTVPNADGSNPEDQVDPANDAGTDTPADTSGGDTVPIGGDSSGGCFLSCINL